MSCLWKCELKKQVAELEALVQSFSAVDKARQEEAEELRQKLDNVKEVLNGWRSGVEGSNISMMRIDSILVREQPSEVK